MKQLTKEFSLADKVRCTGYGFKNVKCTVIGRTYTVPQRLYDIEIDKSKDCIQYIPSSSLKLAHARR